MGAALRQIPAGLIVVLTLAMAGCGGADDAPDQAGTGTAASPPSADRSDTSPRAPADGSGGRDFPGPLPSGGTPAICVGGDLSTARKELVGKSIAVVEAKVREAGCELRVVERDGQALVVTEDYVPTRINVATEGGEVTRYVGHF